MARLEELTAVGVAGETMGMLVQRLTDGSTLKEIATSLEVPYGKLAEWVTEDASRAEQYARASRIWVDSLARETVRISDDTGATKGEAQKAKLRIDTRLRLASKLDRGTYGDQVAISGRIQDDRTPADRDQMLLELARGVAFMFAAVKRRQEPVVPVAALPAPEREVVGSDTPVDEDPI
jgi:hypothetical protein